MTIQLQSFDGGAFAQYSEDAASSGRFLRQYLKLLFSGNYAAGGDALDLTQAGGTVPFPNTVPPAASFGVVDIDLIERGTSAGLLFKGGYYEVISPNGDAPMKFADLANLKLKVFTNNSGSVVEYSAGAYGADVLADIVILEVVYAR